MLFDIDNINKEIKEISNFKKLQQLKNIYIRNINDYIKNVDKNNKELLIDINNQKKKINEIFKNALKKYEKVVSKKQTQKYLPSCKFMGKLHPISQIIHKIEKIMSGFGFTYEYAKEIDTAENIFDKLNIHEFHACRNEQQSFFFLNSKLQPRTQATNVQSKIFSNWNNKDIIKKYSIGRVYRYDSDRTHVPMFHQMDVIYVNSDANISTLKGFIDVFLEKIFNNNITYRMRLSYFPFTTPSYEVDVNLKGNWVELLGCGIIHENVFKNNQKKPTYGFAIGLGIERLCMLLEKCQDLRDLYNNKNIF